MIQWKTSTPPKDGSQILASGRVTKRIGWSDRDETVSVQPFLGEIAWKTVFGFACWYWVWDGMCLASELGDQVKIDFWIPAPRKSEKQSST